jgi:hypothetical protein
MRLRSAVSLLVFGVSPLLAQGRAIDEGTFTITRKGAPTATESFRIVRREDGQITATSHQVSGTQQTRSTLITDSSGTPLRYEMSVKDKGATLFSASAQARGGRLAAQSHTQADDESIREYPMNAGRSIILDGGLLHQLYFVTLVRRPAPFQAIQFRSAHPATVTLTPRGLEPVDVGGKSLTGTHYSLVAGSVRYEMWVDTKGRLLRVEIPAQSLVAAREDAPR